MSKMEQRLFIAAAVVGFALTDAAHARAENTRVCVEISLQRSVKKETAPLKTESPPAVPAPDPPVTRPVVTPPETPAAPLPAAAAPKPAPALRPSADTEKGEVVTPGSEADVLPRELSDKLGRKDGLPLGQRPLAYMKRLIEHFVSHEKGFVAVETGCAQTIHVELYPLLDGWTAFARYSGTGREERVDRLLPSELTQFAERAATSLLYGKPISATINRENVLVSDSKEYAQRVGGSSHFILGVGTDLRIGHFGTVVQSATDPRSGSAVQRYRFFSPVEAFLGYRGRFESWGLEIDVMGGMGTASTSATKNPGGGHVDLSGDAAVQLHFLHYTDPRGLTSFYVGAGSTFELLVFNAITPVGQRESSNRSYLVGGGVDVDLVLGWEFMRASTAQFFLQAEAKLPAYVLSSENSSGELHTWFPAVGFKLGVMF